MTENSGSQSNQAASQKYQTIQLQPVDKEANASGFRTPAYHNNQELMSNEPKSEIIQYMVSGDDQARRAGRNGITSRHTGNLQDLNSHITTGRNQVLSHQLHGGDDSIVDSNAENTDDFRSKTIQESKS